MNAKDNPGLAATSSPGDDQVLTAIKNTHEGKEWECPWCGRPLPFQSLDWFAELQTLAAQHAGMSGIAPDIAGLSIVEAYGVYLHLLATVVRDE